MRHYRFHATQSLTLDSRWASRAMSSNERWCYRILLLVMLTFAMCAGVARADIYRYVNSNGVTTFTNIKPSGNFKLVIREQPEVVSKMIVIDEPTTQVRDYSAQPRSRYSRHILAAARSSNLDPALIHAVITVESGYNPSARSKAGAVGLMQLMPETAARYNVANRWDPEQNIQGGSRYLRDLLQIFDNDLRLALAAYNAGEDAVAKYGNRIPPYRETIAYVPKVMKYYRKYRINS
jgi:soluble lytic murein transglycosylase-like protein